MFITHPPYAELWEVNKSNKRALVWRGRDDVQTGSQDRTGCPLPLVSSYFYLFLFFSNVIYLGLRCCRGFSLVTASRCSTTEPPGKPVREGKLGQLPWGGESGHIYLH